MVSASTRDSYSAAEKLDIIDYALKTSQGKAAHHYGVHKSMISRWMRNLTKIRAADPATRRIGSGRRPYKNSARRARRSRRRDSVRDRVDSANEMSDDDDDDDRDQDDHDFKGDNANPTAAGKPSAGHASSSRRCSRRASTSSSSSAASSDSTAATAVSDSASDQSQADRLASHLFTDTSTNTVNNAQSYRHNYLAQPCMGANDNGHDDLFGTDSSGLPQSSSDHDSDDQALFASDDEDSTAIVTEASVRLQRMQEVASSSVMPGANTRTAIQHQHHQQPFAWNLSTIKMAPAISASASIPSLSPSSVPSPLDSSSTGSTGSTSSIASCLGMMGHLGHVGSTGIDPDPDLSRMQPSLHDRGSTPKLSRTMGYSLAALSQLQHSAVHLESADAVAARAAHAALCDAGSFAFSF
ncbi:hypothetical protein BC831DRAFT_549357 [Entophlyctis helioformis]|nr:hypothetical protein BC831DRAFT_549357 [Entophlyctis helioformis]